MRIKLVLLAVITFFTANTAIAAESTPKEESTGFGAGAVIGAVAGGPAGAIIGAAVGAKIGNTFYRRKKQTETLTADLDSSRTQVSKLERDVDALNGNIDSMGSDLERLRTIARPELLSLMQAGIEMDLLFRTDEHVLADTTGQRLHELAANLASMPDVYIKLDGYADQRGDADYNQGLSVRRVEHVRELLIANGVPEDRITMNGHGETPSTQNDVDSYALERKVSLTLFIEESPSFAANPKH
jgi:outer membrane protein OmpA-like peptidoglycan-associated protein